MALGVDRLTDEEKRLVDSVLARAPSLAQEQRRGLAASLAKALRPKVPGAVGYDDDEAFLNAIVQALRGRALDAPMFATGAGVQAQERKLPMPARLIGGIVFAVIAVALGAVATAVLVVVVSGTSGGVVGLGVSLVLWVIIGFVLQVIAGALSDRGRYRFGADDTVWPPLIGIATGYATAAVNLNLLNGSHPPTDWAYFDGSRFSMTLILSNANLYVWPLVGAVVCTAVALLVGMMRRRR